MTFLDTVAPRANDYIRHLNDLRTDTYEGSVRRAEREDVFRQAVLLLDPVAREVLDRFNDTMLDGSGEVDGPRFQMLQGVEAHWILTWPLQRSARHRIEPGKPVGPVTIRAHFAEGWTHGHLAGTEAGHWPFQVASVEDAHRQWPILWAIAETELHHRIWESYHPWEVVPLTQQSDPAAE